MKTQTRQKDVSSNSFKAPHLNHRLTSHDSLGAAFIRKKPNIKRLLREEEE